MSQQDSYSLVHESIAKSEQLLAQWTNCVNSARPEALSQIDELNHLLAQESKKRLDLMLYMKLQQRYNSFSVLQQNLSPEQKVQLKALKQIYQQLQSQSSAEAQHDLQKYVIKQGVDANHVVVCGISY